MEAGDQLKTKGAAKRRGRKGFILLLLFIVCSGYLFI